jgi:hypothetical protein
MRTIQRVGEVVGRYKFLLAALLMAALPGCVEHENLISRFFSQ